MKIYEFAAIYIPEEIEGQKTTEKAVIIVSPQTILAKDEKQAAMLAARAIPEGYIDRLDRVEIAVRPF